MVGLNDVELGRIRRKFGMVFQYAALFDSMTVMENVAFPLLERYQLPRQEVLDRVREMLTRLDLMGAGEIEDKFPPAAFGRHAQAGGAGPGLDRPPGDSALR